MIQCPHCFSWINDSSILCENCANAIYSPREEEAAGAHATPNRPTVPALGSSVRGLIANIVATYLSVPMFFMAFVLGDRDVTPGQFIGSAAFWGGFWLIPVIVSVCGLRATLAAEAQGNRTRMIFAAKLLGSIALTVLFFCVTAKHRHDRAVCRRLTWKRRSL